MRSAVILTALAVALTLAGCTKRQSLYLEPGHEAAPPIPAEGRASRAAVPVLPRTKAAP